jgi:hypothetical protein
LLSEKREGNFIRYRLNKEAVKKYKKLFKINKMNIKILGTGLPVIFFSFILAFSVGKISKMYNAMMKIEKVMRYGVATVFLLAGIYYLQFLVKYLINL